MSYEISLTEIYGDVPFLEKLSSLAPSCDIGPKDIAACRSIVTRIKPGSNRLLVRYCQKEYNIGDSSSERIGRLWPLGKNHYHCLQNLRGPLRRMHAFEKYAELDMENAHNELLIGHYVECAALQSYCCNRAVHIQDVMTVSSQNREVAKEFF